METEKKESGSFDSEMAEKTESGNSKKFALSKYKKFIPRIVSALVLILVVGLFAYVKFVWRQNNLTSSEAKAKAESFINNNLVQPGMKVELGDAVKENGMFKMKVTIGEGEQKQEVDAYISTDGKKFITSVMDIAEIEEKVAEEKKKEEEADKAIPKSDKPKVDLYVMSFCPYGNKAEDTMKPVYDLLKDKVDFNFHYIVNLEGNKIQSLHGEPEVLQNKREACVLKYHGKDKWFDFVTYINKNCGTDGACFEEGLKSIGLVASKISACASSEGLTLMKQEAKVSSENKAEGSPTLMINGFSTKSVYKYGNADAYKQVICGAFNQQPEECAKELAANTTTSEGGSCN